VLVDTFVDEFIKINEEIPGTIALPGLGFITGSAVANSIGQLTVFRAAVFAALNSTIPYVIPFGSSVPLRILAASALRTVGANLIVVSLGFEAGIALVALERAINTAIDTATASNSCG
jgi:hypothetical protein